MSAVAEKILREAWEPISEQPAPEWITENVEMPEDSELKNFDFELFPLALFVITKLCHFEGLRRLTEMLSAQVGKTVTMLAFLCWLIKNKPRGVGWYTDTNTNAKGDYKTKILPALESCPKVAPLLPSDRSKKNNTLIQLGFMNLRVMGAETKRNREGKTISVVLCDEVRNYPPGAMEQIDNRFKTVTNWLRVLFSSAGDITKEPWPSFQRGTRHLGFWSCPHCNHEQTFRFGRKKSPIYSEDRTCGGFVWVDNEKTHPSEDVYDFRELLPTVRYQCENPACKYEFTDAERIELIRGMVKLPDFGFKQTNPMADPTDVSVHCWEAYMPFAGCSGPAIVQKFLNASVKMRQGNIEPMKVFVMETLGEPWEEHGEKPLEGEIMKRCGEYSTGEEWDKAPNFLQYPNWLGQITADNQHGFVHYNYSIFNRDGGKRLIQRGQFATFDELRTFQQSKGVKDRAVGIDCAHRPADVYRECLKYGRWIADPTGGRDHFWNGWVPLLGDDADEYTHFILDKDKQRIPIKTKFKAVLINANEGFAGGPKQIHRFFWSNPHYKTQLYFYRIKGEGLLWEIPKNIDPEYVKQMQATEYREIRNAEGVVTGGKWHEKGRHDDSDCELMQLALADINNITKK